MGPNTRRQIGLLLCVAAVAAALPTLTGCRSEGPIYINREPVVVADETAASLVDRLVDTRNQIRTFQAHLSGRVAWQGDPSGFGLPPKNEPRKPGEPGKGIISKGHILANRQPGEQRQTTMLVTFPNFRAVFEMVGLDEAFWVRKFQKTRRFITGTLDPIAPRPELWTTIRPQDIGTLLFYDDLFPEEEGQKSTVYLEAWPDFYILHVLRIDRKPEPIYSRLWIHRESLRVFVHQLFDSDGALVAEARIKEYRDVPTAGERPYDRRRDDAPKVAVPATVILYWPRDRVVFNVELKNVRLNGDLDQKFFAAPDPKAGAQIKNISE